MAGSVTVTNARIFDGHAADLTEADIRIEDGRIVAIGRDLAEDGPVIDAQDRVVTPGFIDNHFHAYGISLNMMQMEASKTSYVALLGAQRLRRALARGFTTVRDVAGGDIGLSRAIAEGLIEAPHYYYTGPALSQTGGHGDPRDAHLDMCCCGSHGTEVVDGVDALRVAVRDRLRTGAHAIKIMASGGVVSLTDPIRIPQYSPEEIRVVVEEAGRRGSYVAAHAYSPESIVHAVTNGVRSIEHGNLLDNETAQLMAEREAVLVPTLVTYLAMSERGRDMGMAEVALRKNTEVLEAGKNAIELAAAAGVAAAMTRMGMICHNALGVERDPEQAARWWAKGVEAGDADAMAMLGAANHLGQGVERDPMRAMTLLIMAQELGAPMAGLFFEAVRAGIPPEAFEKADRLARDLLAQRRSAP